MRSVKLKLWASAQRTEHLNLPIPQKRFFLGMACRMFKHPFDIGKNSEYDTYLCFTGKLISPFCRSLTSGP